jgi:Papain family cysteine protease
VAIFKAATICLCVQHFNWCDEDGLNSCTASWNQHIPVYCGSCWAHGTLAAIQDRLKIRKGGLGKDVMLSRQALLNCGAFDGFGGGCNGGDPIDVFHYMQKVGILSFNVSKHCT